MSPRSVSSRQSSHALSERRSSDDGLDKKRCCCCHPCLVLLLVLVLAAVGGVLVWQLLPEDQKNSIKGVVDSGASGVSGDGTDDLGEAPTFDYYRCSSDEDCCNGVDTICDLRLSEVMFAGLHNAMATKQDGFLFAGNHEFQLESALQAGFRGINVDVGNCDGSLVLVHNQCTLGSREPYEVFNHVNLFLEKHPRDLVLMPLQINNDVDEPVDLFDLYAILESVPGFTDRMYVHNQTQLWPTMRSLIESDKRIVMFIYNAGTDCSSGDCPPGFHPYFLYASETLYEFETVQDIENTQQSCPYDRGVDGYKDFYVVNSFVSDPLPSKSSAAIINQKSFLQDHIAACRNVVGRAVNMVFIDFWEQGDLVDLVQTHNQNLGG